MISPHDIDRVREAADIVEVVGDYVNLKKSGRNWKGLSPFNDEKTPSFYVSPEKGIFKDFSSGRGGDVIKFVMEVDGLSYPEAIRNLAAKFNIEIAEIKQENSEVNTKRDSLYIALSFARDLFKRTLVENDQGKSIGGSYFKERGLSEVIIDKFDLGYSLDQWNFLYKEAKTNQFSEEILEEAGLIIKTT